MVKALSGVSLQNYRGIGKEQYIGPFGRCNFFIGTNNSGKSAVLNFLSSHGERLNELGATSDSTLGLAINPLEVHLGKTIHEVTIGIAFSQEQITQRLMGQLNPQFQYESEDAEQTIRKFVDMLAIDGLVWMSASAGNLKDAKLDDNRLKQAFRTMAVQDERRILSSAILGKLPMPQGWHPYVHPWVMRAFSDGIGKPRLIPAIRQIGKKGVIFSDYSGQGLIDELASIQNPGVMERGRREQFDRINKLLQNVISVPSAQIEIPHDRSEVLVHADGRVLPLSFLGTGIHEIVMIASFCTLTEDSIVCIEEPEIHLHPLLQRKLVDYLITKTTNQYFIATHSASIIDFPGATIFHVTKDNGETVFSHVTRAFERVGVCRDLGYKASDLLQTNFVIWVEGPSDRIYLMHWLYTKAADLTEGVHFSIMFYGGRLLNHLSGHEEIVDDFINLRRLNQHMAILIDSDLRGAGQKLNATKCRVIKEFEEHKNIAWVTDGREIESYFSPEVISTVLKSRYDDFLSLAESGTYADPLAFRKKSYPEEIAQPDKRVLARQLCQIDADFSILNLGKRVESLVAAIRAANR